MACPDENTIERFLAGALDEAERRRVKAHLADCTPCCQLASALVMRTATETASRETDARAAPVGAARLSRYRIDQPLGVGGMGIVYSAYDPELDRRVALKVLWSSLAAGESDAGRLHREARAMAKLAHPNVVPIFDVGAAGDRVFLAMELAEGGTMRDWMKEGPRPWREVLLRLGQAGAGLAAAHRAGLIHRDFKPENLLLRVDGTVLVTDFGLAHEVPFGEALSTLSSQEGAGAPGVAGTPAYMAPEQLRGEALDARADVYAFSVVAWEALHGARPFSPADEAGLLGAIAKGPPDPALPAEHERVPERVRRALVRGLSFRRRDRPASMDALLSELTVEQATAPLALSRARRSVLLGVGGAAVLVAGIVLGRSSAPPSPPEGEARVTSGPVSAATRAMTIDAPAPSASGPAPAPSASFASASASAPAPSGARVPGPRAVALPGATATARRPVERSRHGALRGMDFTPYGLAGAAAGDVVRAHAADFDACWNEGCVDITCRFDVGEGGRVTRASCFTWEGRPACPATEACVAQRIRALRFPPPPPKGEGECSLFFGQ
jgi:serine/threonine protein kinase